nr:MAG TPA: hypothetical protein [Caudoviricetes sp.]
MTSFFSPFFFSKYATESYLCCVFHFFVKKSNNALFMHIY